MKTLALFDFDGTVTKTDSLIHYFIYMSNSRFKKAAASFYFGALYLFMRLGMMNNQRFKERCFSFLFKNIHQRIIIEKSNRFSVEILPGIIRQSALDRIYWHKKQNHRVIIVSASLNLYLQNWCESHGIELISSELEWENDFFTGRIKGRECSGDEKVKRLSRLISFKEYTQVYAYGDSKSDRPMLSLANFAFYKPFRKNGEAV